MIYYEILKVALGSLRANPLRSVLTMLGIIIGVAAVIVMVALGTGAQAEVEERISSLGTNLLEIQRGWGRRSSGARNRSERLNIEDARALQERLTSATAIVPISENEAQVEQGNQNLGGIDIVGTWANWAEVNSVEIAQGRFFDQNEAETRQRVAVLGPDVVEELFPVGVDPVGAEVRIAGASFDVVGVMAEQGGGADDEIIIPMPADAVAAAFAFAAAIGIVFGFYPAFRASRLDPIEALRYE